MMKILAIKMIVISVLAALLTACVGSPAYEYRRNSEPETIKIAIGQTVTAPASGLTVTFDSIEQDSRCPINAKCLWEGVAIVNVSVKKDDEPATKLALGSINFEKINDSERAYGKTISFVELLPKPEAGDKKPAGTATLAVKIR